MKQSLTTALKTVARDRWLFGLSVLNVALWLLLMIVLAMTIRPNETQVITRYSAYGVASFYRGYWYTLWQYGLLGLLVVVGHIALGLKLVRLERRPLALALLVVTIGILLMIILVARSVIKIAALG